MQQGISYPLTIVRNSPLPSVQSPAGTVLIEFAICFGLILYLIAGVIDIWALVRELNLMLTASRHGARIAAALAHELELEGNLTDACNDSSGASAALTAGAAMAYRYLVATGLETGGCAPTATPVRSCTGASFTVSAAFATLKEGTFSQRAIRVSVSSNGVRPCIFCFPGLSPGVMLQRISEFAVEANCAALGP